MKKEILKHLKKKTREELGPVPPTKVQESKKTYKRKPKHKPLSSPSEESTD
ncbi:MAG: hypothetical protein WED33_07265 [Bacteroidia bacterium]